MCLVFVLLGISFTLFFYYWTKDILHPCLIFSTVWCLTCAISSFDRDDYMLPWCFEMYVVTILSSCSFFVGSLFYLCKRKKMILYSQIHIPYIYTFIIRFLFIICFSCFIIEWIHGGGQIALLLIDTQGDLKTAVSEGIAGIHYGTIFLPYIAILSLFKIINSNNKNIIEIFIIVIIIAITIGLKISRGDMVIFILSFFFIYSRYKKITVKAILFTSLILFSILIGFMLIRVGDGTVVTTTTDNPYWSILYTYIATPFANLNDYILENYPYHLLGDLTLAPLWTLTGQKENVEVVITTQLGIFNMGTYLYGVYHDYKLLGCLGFSFSLGIILSATYYYASCIHQFWILLLAAMQKAIFVPFFGNYFTGEFVTLFPYLLIIFIIVFVLRYKKKRLKLCDKNLVWL